MQVPVTRPKNIETFESTVIAIADERRRAIPLLFDNIMEDV